MGSALKILRLAEGWADLYPRFGPTMEWDTAAPQVVLHAAGGRLTAMDGKPLGLWQVRLAQPQLRLHGPRAIDQLTERLAPDPAGIAQAAALLRDGRLVAFGTETVYGLGADATNGRAVAAIFAAKGRPHFNPLICHYADADAAFRDVVPSDLAHRLARQFWPGPLTLVLPAAGSPAASRCWRGPAWTRWPCASPPTRPPRPCCAKPAGRWPRPPPTAPARFPPPPPAMCWTGWRDASKPCWTAAPVPSAWRAPCSTSPPAPPACCGPAAWRRKTSRPSSARSAAASHPARPKPPAPCAPRACWCPTTPPTLPVRLDATHAEPGEAYLALGPAPDAPLLLQLSATGDLVEAAAALFAGLRELDREGQRLGLRGIAVAPVPDTGLGRAINDRLQRAAAPRG